MKKAHQKNNSIFLILIMVVLVMFIASCENSSLNSSDSTIDTTQTDSSVVDNDTDDSANGSDIDSSSKDSETDTSVKDSGTDDYSKDSETDISSEDSNTDSSSEDGETDDPSLDDNVTYTVTFKDYDGTVLYTAKDVLYGEAVTPPRNPTRQGFDFVRWDQSFDCITENLVVTAIYSEKTNPYLVVNNAVMNAESNEVSVSISIMNNPGIASLKFIIEYESSLTLKAVSFNSDFDAYVTAPEPFKNPQSISLVNPVENTEENGVLVTLTFETSSKFEETYISLVLDEGNTFNSDFEAVSFEIINGKITVE